MNDLISVLEEQIKIYRNLLDVVRKEKEILISAQLDELNENNRTKEAILLKAKELEVKRMQRVLAVAQELGISPDQEVRLTDLANRAEEVFAERLRNIHSVLDLLFKRIQDHNRQNETLVQSALDTMTGAMQTLRDTLKEKPTYQRKGEIGANQAPSGQLVRREV